MSSGNAQRNRAIQSSPIRRRLFDTRRRPIVLLSLYVILPITAVVATVDLLAAVVIALVVADFFLQFALAILYAYVRELVDQNVAGTALSVLNAVGFLGAFSTPIITGVFIERTEDYGLSFLYAGILVLAGIALTGWVPEANG